MVQPSDQISPLNFSQFVEGQSWCTWARGGIEDTRLGARDGLCNGEELGRFAASVYGPGTGSVGWEPLSFGDLWANWENAVILSSTQFTLR